MITAKFIQGLRDTTVITQERIESKIEMVQDIDNFGYATFTMPIVDGVQEDTIVELYFTGNTDVLLFRGYIHEIKPIWLRFGEMEVTLRAEKSIFYRRLVLEDKTYSNTNVQTLLEDLVGDYNSAYDENWTVDVDFVNTMDLELTTGDNYYDILDEMAEQWNAKRKIENGRLSFATVLGVDRSTGSDYQEVVFNPLSPSNANIKNIEVVGTASRANIVISSNKSGNKIVNDSGFTADGVLYGVHYEPYRNGSQASKTQKKLDNINQLQRSYKVEVEQNTLIANAGDSVRLTIENTNSFFDFDGPVLVTKKTTVYDNASFIYTYDLQESTTIPITMETYLKGIKKKIKLLQI